MMEREGEEERKKEREIDKKVTPGKEEIRDQAI